MTDPGSPTAPSEGETVLVLRVEPPAGAPFQQRVEGGEAIVGRSSKVDITVPDRYLSRQQARFFREAGRWLVEDLGGRNPTVLNGRSVEDPTPLAPGDLLVMSGARISVLRLEQSGEAGGLSGGSDSSDSLFRPASGLIERHSESDERTDGEDLRRQAELLRRLNEFSRALAAPIQLEALLELVLDRVFADFQPEEAVVFLRQPDGDFGRAAVRRLPGVPDDFLYSRSLVREVTEKELAALVNDASADERFAAAESIQASGIRSLLAAPLLDPEGCPGMVVLNSRARRRRFSEVDMEELVALAAAAALRIRNIALADEAAEHRVLEKELTLARQIQMALLPAALPEVDGYELEAHNVPNREVSGDLYQVRLRTAQGGEECVLFLADVSGKGMSASLLTASLEALAAGPIEEGLPPEEVFARVSRRLHDRTSPERYATGFIASLNPSTGRFRWASAGHNPVLLLRAGGDVERLDATGLPLGLLPLGAYTGEDRILDPGDMVVVYTDGITEAANPEGEEYGVERLVELCQRESSNGLGPLVERLVAELDDFVAGTPYGDDRTFLMLRRRPG